MDPLPVPPQLEAQLAKCKTVRKSDYYKPRNKTQAVSIPDDLIGSAHKKLANALHLR